MQLEALDWQSRFVSELPADPDLTNTSRQVYEAAFSRVAPTPVKQPKLIAWSPEVAALLDLDEATVRSDRFAQVFAGNQLVEGMDPYAAAYGGHQFGAWAGQLGDGRAITLGEVRTDSGGLELQLKGAGPTPYSRFADGRAVLRSSIREFLCSEAMFHLGVPTTRALSLVETGDTVIRDMFYDGNPIPERGAVVCRVAPSFLRLGNFQLPASRGDVATLKALVQHTVRVHFPELGPYSKDAVLAWLSEVCVRTARLMAEWMRVGFVHGVMNTDNLSVLGLTIDYGPYGWIDGFDLDWTPNTTDAQHRRYRFGMQPNIAAWNMYRFAESLNPLIEDVEALEQALQSYHTTWETVSQELIAAKLGLQRFEPTDQHLWNALVTALGLVETDMTLFFRGLAELTDDRLDAIEEAFYVAPSPEQRDQWLQWIRRYLQRLERDGVSPADRREAMNRVNPKYVLRNYLAQEAIEQAEQGDPSRISEVLEVMRRPYDEQPGREEFAKKRPDWARHKPGCSMLSCSS